MLGSTGGWVAEAGDLGLDAVVLLVFCVGSGLISPAEIMSSSSDDSWEVAILTVSGKLAAPSWDSEGMMKDKTC